jgi:predicted acylesterase/phospholipase RssA
MLDRRGFLGLAPALLGAAAVAPAGLERRHALVLTGGGARGSYQAGVLAGLVETGRTYDIICGTSIGAINGALLAQGNIAVLADLWSNIGRFRLLQPIDTAVPLVHALGEIRDEWRGVLSRPYNVLRGLTILYDHGRIFQRTGFFKSQPIEEFLFNHLELSSVRTTFAFAVTNLNTAGSEAFYVTPGAQLDIPSSLRYKFHRLDATDTTDRTLYRDAIRASAAIPIAFEPVRLEPRGSAPGRYADGGVALNAPIALARRLGATDITAIAVDPPSKPQPINGLLDVVFQTFATTQTRLIYDQIADDRSDTPLLSLDLVQPAVDPPIGPLDFDRQAGLDAAFEMGRTDGRRGPITIPLDSFSP